MKNISDWRDVEGAIAGLQVSSTGQIRKQSGDEYHDVTQHLNRHGYLFIRIQGKNLLVHRLVAAAFIPNPLNLPIVHHINGDKSDNRVGNLFWCTPKQNVDFRFTESGRRNGAYRSIEQLSKDGEVIGRYKSFKDCAIALGRDKDTNLISKCCKGERKTAYGYKWRFGQGDPMYKTVTHFYSSDMNLFLNALNINRIETLRTLKNIIRRNDKNLSM